MEGLGELFDGCIGAVHTDRHGGDLCAWPSLVQKRYKSPHAVFTLKDGILDLECGGELFEEGVDE